MNPPETAPKDGTIFLAHVGYPYLTVCRWNAPSSKWVVALPQTNFYDGAWDDFYFENEFEDENQLLGWIPLPIA